MREIYPSHYAAFHCIAGACPDSCCKEWEIVVDTASAERYRSVSGTLGERLRQAMITDADGDIIFQERNSRCPFWNAQQLCDIHGELGEDALCETCRLFPRITQDYGDFIEFDISPACPEAARLLFSLTPKQWQLTERSSPAMTEEPPEYAVIFLLTTNRGAFLDTILSRCILLETKPVSGKMIERYLGERYKIPEEEAEFAAGFSLGNIGKAESIILSEELKDLTLDILRYIHEIESYEIADKVKEYKKYKARIDDFFDIFLMWFRDILLLKADTSPNKDIARRKIIFKNEYISLRKQADKLKMDSIDYIINRINRARIRIKSNVNFDAALELLIVEARREF